MPPDLIVSHEGALRFRVRGPDGTPLGEEVTLPSPEELSFPDWPDDQGVPYTLLGALRWYLELYPYCVSFRHPRWRQRAQQVVRTLDGWGRDSFNALSQGRRVHEAMYAARARLEGLTLRVLSADPAVLAWPWEALRDPMESGPISLFAALERTVPGLSEPARQPEAPPPGPLRVLLVSPRPFARDIDARAVSGPLVAAVQKDGLPVEITAVRPPTFVALQQFVKAHDYDVLHVDGHGDQHGGQGVLVFEDPPEPEAVITAAQLAIALGERPAPVVVLTACRSACFDPAPAEPFSTLATELLRGGVDNVVAMAYVLHRDAAACFTPALYQALARERDVGRAVSAARRALLKDRKREAAWPERVDLHDDLLPVHYTRRAARLPEPGPAPRPRLPAPPAEAGSGPWLFGRDGDLRRLERALSAVEPLIVVVGPPGAGKSLLLGDLVRWLHATGGPPALDWVDLGGLPSASALLNRLGFPQGQPFFQLNADDRVRRLVGGEGQRPALWVWEGLEAIEAWSPEDQDTVRGLIEALRGRTLRVLATARAIPQRLRGVHVREVAVEALDGDWCRPGLGVRSAGRTCDDSKVEVGHE